ncbi:Phenazine biosynthesis-like protein, putative [Leishmania lindenbergi]|uniref:Phenazine biosynthesis-like protein n=1 Tax=Leishmania lindenbergi TaxID=651832 RepID=A0AAW3AMD8_9TRYP
MEPRHVVVSTPMMVCDAFTTDRFKGNPAAVCFVPTSVYCMEWSALSSLEASLGRGEPEVPETKMTEKDRQAAAEKYAVERNAKMGRAFQQVAKEMNLSETAFVYRLPTSRIRTIHEQIMRKCNEFEDEYEEKVKHENEERRRMSTAVTEDDEAPVIVVQEQSHRSVLSAIESSETPTHQSKRLSSLGAPPSPGLLPSSSFSMANSGVSFLYTRASNSIMVGSEMCRRPRRMHAQWFGLRWFTPTKEVPLCGHATFAAAHAIFEVSRLVQSESTRHLVSHIPMEFFVPAQTDVLCFVTESGVISVRCKAEPIIKPSDLVLHSYTCPPDMYEVHFPMTEAFSVKEAVPKDLYSDVAAALGLMHGAGCVEDIAYSKSTGYYIARLSTSQNVLECHPNWEALRRAFSSPRLMHALKEHSGVLGHIKGLGVTAQSDGHMRGPAGNVDVVSRFFAPWMGVDEDPVTGSLYLAILPYWLRLRQKGHFKVGDRLQFYQASKRGGFMTGIVIGRKAERVALIGPVLTFMRGNCTFEVEEVR